MGKQQCHVKMGREKKDEGQRERDEIELRVRPGRIVLLNAVKLQTSYPTREAVGAGKKKNFRPQHVIPLALLS